MKFKNGVIYHGEWKGNVREGYGVQVWPDGAKYEGEWQDGKANGKGILELMKENSLILTVTFTKETGRTIKLVDLGPISISTEPSTKANGLMIISTAREYKPGLMAVNMMDTTLKAKKMGRVDMSGGTAVITLELGRTIR